VCTSHSGKGILAPVYDNALVRVVQGRLYNMVRPTMLDVLVLNGFGEWTSSLSSSGTFALTLSKPLWV
jgi:hypothetical protein